MRLIAEGAEALIYSGKFLGLEAVVKHRVEKHYRIKSLDVQLRKQRTKVEARVTSAASSVGAMVPRVLMVSTYDIYMTKIAGVRLDEFLKGTEGEKVAAHRTLFSAGSELGILHNADIVHGDYTPANVIVGRGGDAIVIDFGLSEITNSTESKAVDLLLMKRSLNPDQYISFANGYAKSAKEARDIMQRLSAIETRGRYKTRTLITNGDVTA